MKRLTITALLVISLIATIALGVTHANPILRTVVGTSLFWLLVMLLDKLEEE